jgi:5'-nucleotidase
MAAPQILITNDDGFDSPGLWAAAQAVADLGDVHVVAPREQQSGAGRSMPNSYDGIIDTHHVELNGRTVKAYSVGGTPAQVVLHALLEILPEYPSLLISGINFGENMGTGITISGTVGAAMESASMGIPSIAVSLETHPDYYHNLSDQVDFSGAAWFSRYFTEQTLANGLPQDVDLLKLEIPASATSSTPWRTTRLARKRYYQPTAPKRDSWDVRGLPGYRPAGSYEQFDKQSDVYAVQIDRVVSVTPLSLDMTARIDLDDLNGLLGKGST